MPAGLELQTASGSPVELPLRLSEVVADQGRPGQAQPVSYALVNTGTTIFVELALWIDGPGAAHVALAMDDDGAPGIWATPGESIVPDPTTLRPGERASFWVLALFMPDDVEDLYPFDLQVTARSIGQNTGVALP